MSGSGARRLRGVVRNALAWGVSWSAAGFVLLVVLRLVGVLDELSLIDALGMAVKFGFIGVVAGAAFSALIGLLYRGKRLADISWVRFGLGGAIMTGLFVPLFFQVMNIISGDGLVAWNLVLDDSIWASVFGGVAAAGSLKLAQRADRGLLPAGEEGLDRLESVDRAGGA